MSRSKFTRERAEDISLLLLRLRTHLWRRVGCRLLRCHLTTTDYVDGSTFCLRCGRDY